MAVSSSTTRIGTLRLTGGGVLRDRSKQGRIRPHSWVPSPLLSAQRRSNSYARYSRQAVLGGFLFAGRGKRVEDALELAGLAGIQPVVDRRTLTLSVH